VVDGAVVVAAPVCERVSGVIFGFVVAGALVDFPAAAPDWMVPGVSGDTWASAPYPTISRATVAAEAAIALKRVLFTAVISVVNAEANDSVETPQKHGAF
jgi:hypothetical protein